MPSPDPLAVLTPADEGLASLRGGAWTHASDLTPWMLHRLEVLPLGHLVVLCPGCTAAHDRGVEVDEGSLVELGVECCYCGAEPCPGGSAA